MTPLPTLSVEKIPVVFKLPVKLSMASIGTQEKSGNLGIYRLRREVGQKFTLISVHHKLNVILCINIHCTVQIP